MKHLLFGLLAVVALTSCNDDKKPQAAPAQPVVEKKPAPPAPVVPTPAPFITQDDNRIVYGNAGFVLSLERTMKERKFAMSEVDQKKANARWDILATRLKFNGSETDQKALEIALEPRDYDHQKGFKLFTQNKVVYTLDMKKWYSLSKGYAEKGELLLAGVPVGTYITYAQDVYETPMRKTYNVIVQDLCTNEYVDSCDLNSHKTSFTREKIVVQRENGRVDNREGSIHVYTNDEYQMRTWKRKTEARLKEVEKNLETLTDDLEDVGKRLTTVFTTITSVEEALKKKVDSQSLKSQLEVLSAEFKKLLEEKAKAEMKVADAKLDKEKFDQEKRAFDKEVTTLKERILALEGKIAELKKAADKTPDKKEEPKTPQPKVVEG